MGRPYPLLRTTAQTQLLKPGHWHSRFGPAATKVACIWVRRPDKCSRHHKFGARALSALQARAAQIGATALGLARRRVAAENARDRLHAKRRRQRDHFELQRARSMEAFFAQRLASLEGAHAGDGVKLDAARVSHALAPDPGTDQAVAARLDTGDSHGLLSRHYGGSSRHNPGAPLHAKLERPQIIHCLGDSLGDLSCEQGPP